MLGGFRGIKSIHNCLNNTTEVRKNKEENYLFLQLLSELLGLALLVIVHDHHGGIDLPYRHVTGWEGESRNHQTLDMTMIFYYYNYYDSNNIFLFFNIQYKWLSCKVAVVMLMSPLWMGTSRSSVFWERWGQMTLISFCRSRSIWFRSSPPGQLHTQKNKKDTGGHTCSVISNYFTSQWVCVCRVLIFLLTSGYLDLQGRADEGHEGGGEVDGHVIVHRHVHQD